MLSSDHRRDPNVEYSFMDADPQVVAREAEMLDFMKNVLETSR